MDGNGRWATARGLPRLAGHRAGADAVTRTVEAARELGVGALTLYAFSSDNWKRPPEEVIALMQMFRAYLEADKPRCVETGIRLPRVAAGRRRKQKVRSRGSFNRKMNRSRRQSGAGSSPSRKSRAGEKARRCPSSRNPAGREGPLFSRPKTPGDPPLAGRFAAS